MSHKRSPNGEARQYLKQTSFFDRNNKEMVSQVSTRQVMDHLILVFESLDFKTVPDLYSNGEIYDVRGTVLSDSKGSGSFQIFDSVWR